MSIRPWPPGPPLPPLEGANQVSGTLLSGYGREVNLGSTRETRSVLSYARVRLGAGLNSRYLMKFKENRQMLYDSGDDQEKRKVFSKKDPTAAQRSAVPTYPASCSNF